MKAAGWTRVDPRPWRSNRAKRENAAGWRLEHCGHPTAITPWALYEPGGKMILTGVLGEARNPEFGTAWPRLSSAIAWVASQAACNLAQDLRTSTNQQKGAATMTKPVIALSSIPLMKTSQLHVLIEEMGGKKTISRNKPFLLRAAEALVKAAHQREHEAGKAEAERQLKEEAEKRKAAAPAIAEKRVKAKPEAKEKPEKKESKEKGYEHDPRVGPVGTVYEREHDGVVHKIQVHERGFLWLNHREKGIYRSSSKIAKEITGTGWFGLVFFRVVPYNRREARGVDIGEIGARYQEAAEAFNKAAPASRLPVSLEAILASAPGDARAVGKAMAKAADHLRQLATALSVAANRVEVKHGRDKEGA